MALSFTVRRHEPVLVAPAKPTPKEFKLLSDIDDQRSLRFLISLLSFFRNSPSMAGRDPARVIREALAKALVFYYPLAGRLRETPAGKLVVECTGEGVLFVEADADIRLEQFGDPPRPPFPCSDELIHDVEGSGGVLHCPLLLIQVTRLTCGGFIVGYRFNHTMCDGSGISQFMSAVSEIARGAGSPSVPPIWSRELLTARDPPVVTHLHREYDEVPNVGISLPATVGDRIVRRSFFFGPSELSALRRHVPPNLSSASTFELITACVWRCRTVALTLSLHPQQEVRALFTILPRSKISPPRPAGYYGNVFATPVAVSTADELSTNQLGYAVELVRKAKSEVTPEYLQSVADLMVLRGRPRFVMSHTYLASDVTRAGLERLDFGWGAPEFHGPTSGSLGYDKWEADTSFYTWSRNEKGERGVLVPVSLPASAMERFMTEIQNITKEPTGETKVNGTILSSL